MLTELEREEIELWTAHELLFIEKKKLKKFLPYTSCMKIKYDNRIKRYLENMEQKHPEKGTGVAIKLDGKVRYVWRSDLLTEKEFDEIRKKNHSRFGILSKKSKRSVGKGGEGS